METLEDIFRFIDALPLEETERNNIKFVLLAQRYDGQPTSHDLEKLKLELTIRFGVLVAAGVGVLATLIKLL